MDSANIQALELAELAEFEVSEMLGASPRNLGVVQARAQFPQVIADAVGGQVIVVRNKAKSKSEPVVILSLGRLREWLRDKPTKVTHGRDILARLPFTQSIKGTNLELAPLPNPGLPSLMEDLHVNIAAQAK
jgi:hypothetical protein